MVSQIIGVQLLEDQSELNRVPGTIKTEYREDAYYIEVCNKLDRKTSKYICTDMRTKKI